MLRIGAFAEITGVTRRLLRHYEAVGVLSPALTDARTGYRYYTRDQIPALQRMLAYRAAGVPLSAIPSVIGSRDGVSAVLERQRATLLEERASLDKMLALIDAELAGRASSPPFRLKRTTPAWAVSVRQVVETYAEADALMAETRRGFTVHDETPSAAIWHLCRPAEGHIDCEMQVVFARPPVRSRYPVRPLPAQLVVSFAHTGPDSELPAIYDAMKAWSRTAHYASCGPLREVYWDGVIDVQFPVCPA